jgi:Ca-activated chloride channel homolog
MYGCLPGTRGIQCMPKGEIVLHKLRTGVEWFMVLVLAAAAAGQQNGSPTAPQPDSSPQSQNQGLQNQGSQNNNDLPNQNSPNQDVPANGQQDTFVFRRQVEEVVLHATVVDEKQRPVTHLDRSAFTVFEDGQPQVITSFRREDVPVEIGIVIDNSSSMRAKRDEVNQAVLNLIRASNPQDEVFVVNFSEAPYLDQDFTSDVRLLEAALHRTTTQGSTALYDAIVASAAHLAGNPRLEKKMLLVITDGKDNMSQATLQEAMRRLQQKNGPALYAIGLMGTEYQAREALTKLADATGGSVFFPDSLGQVNDITRALAHDIRNQYTIAYRPKSQSANGKYHPIVVEAKSTGYGRLTVHTRNGYYTGESVH